MIRPSDCAWQAVRMQGSTSGSATDATMNLREFERVAGANPLRGLNSYSEALWLSTLAPYTINNGCLLVCARLCGMCH